MSDRLLMDRVTGSQGTFRVSTVRTDAGGGEEHIDWISGASSKDYIDENPWPYETMVFREAGSTGYYHQAYATEKEALAGHTEIIDLIKKGDLEIGKGVTGEYGNPSLTAEQWNNRVSV